MAPDIDAATDLVRSGALAACPGLPLPALAAEPVAIA
jgi:hypothetical protein